MAQPPRQDKEVVSPKPVPTSQPSPYADQVSATRTVLSDTLGGGALAAINAGNAGIDKGRRK